MDLNFFFSSVAATYLGGLGVLVLVSGMDEVLVGSGSVGSDFDSGSEDEVSERFMVVV